jgi:hypothetical protein
MTVLHQRMGSVSIGMTQAISSSIGEGLSLVHCRFDNWGKKLASIRHTSERSASREKAAQASCSEAFPQAFCRGKTSQ